LQSRKKWLEERVQNRLEALEEMREESESGIHELEKRIEELENINIFNLLNRFNKFKNFRICPICWIQEVDQRTEELEKRLEQALEKRAGKVSLRRKPHGVPPTWGTRKCLHRMIEDATLLVSAELVWG
jgi:hypothetical protein